MSDTPDTENGAPDLDVIAGEYVLGLLDAAAAGLVRARAATDPALAAAIAAWRHRLDPLADLAAPVPPSDLLWQRIARDIRPAAPAHPAPAPAQTRWRAVALGSLALAACLGWLLVQSDLTAPAPAGPLAASLLSAPGEVPATLRAQVTGAGTITVVPLRHVTIAPGEALGFWAWPPTEKAPVFLGMIGPDGGQVRFPYPARDGTPVMVTQERQGQTPGATPGKTLFIGLLVARQG